MRSWTILDITDDCCWKLLLLLFIGNLQNRTPFVPPPSSILVLDNFIAYKASLPISFGKPSRILHPVYLVQLKIQVNPSLSTKLAR